MERKTPAARGDRGVEFAGERFHGLDTRTSIQVQHLIARHALTIEAATTIAALHFGGARHG